MYKHVLIPTDGSERSLNAVRQGVALAGSIGARLTFMTVTRPLHSLSAEPEMVSGMNNEARTYVHDFLTADAKACLADATGIADAAGIACDTARIEHDHIYQAIIDTAARRGCDLIVMASHGRSGLAAIVLGSETVKVLTHSEIPVLVYR